MQGEKHELEYRWTFWIDKSSKDRDKYQESLHNLVTVDSVEDFWICWSAILNHKSLPPQHTLCMFKEGIKPTWEDPQNRDGGRWSIYIPPQIFAYAKRVVNTIFLSVIGCQIEPTEKICGVVLRKRDYGITVDIWSTNISQTPEVQGEVSQKVDEIIKTEFGSLISEDNAIHPASYIPHPGNAPQLVQSQSHGKKRYDRNRRGDGNGNGYPRSQHNSPSGFHSSPSPHSPSYLSTSPTSSSSLLHGGNDNNSNSSNNSGSGLLGDSGMSLSVGSGMNELTPPIILGHRKSGSRTSINANSEINDDDDVIDDRINSGNGRGNDHVRVPSASLASWLAAHKKSASESVTDTIQTRGTEDALPILLKRGFDIPTSAYFDIAQNKINASKAHNPNSSNTVTTNINDREAEKRHIRKRASVGGGNMPPKFVLDHRRAYSLDKSSEDAYSKYVKEKQGTAKISFEGLSFYTPQSAVSPDETPLEFTVPECPDLPIPGISQVNTEPFPGIGIPGMEPSDSNASAGEVPISNSGEDDASEDDWIRPSSGSSINKKLSQRHRSSGLCVVTPISQVDEEEEEEDDEDDGDKEEEEEDKESENNDNNNDNDNDNIDDVKEDKKVDNDNDEKEEEEEEEENDSIETTTTRNIRSKDNGNSASGRGRGKSPMKFGRGEAQKKKEVAETAEVSKPKRVISPLSYRINYFLMLVSIVICILATVIFALLLSAHFIIY